MDWREFIRKFFGPPPPQRGRDPNVWPPPPPIPEFSEDGNNERGNAPPAGEGNDNPVSRRPPRLIDELDAPLFPRAGFFWGQRPNVPNRSPPEEELDQEFGNSNQFVFGDVFAAVGEMFQEMERSMRDMEKFFGNIDESFPPGYPNQESVPAITPPAAPAPGPGPRKDDNVRDFVLRESDRPVQEKPIGQMDEGSNRSRHYIAEPAHPSDKVDRDLDLLYQKSMLDLSDLPVPSKGESQKLNPGTSLSPYGSQGRLGGGGGPAFRSFSQSTSQTYIFRNGRMEGEIVKEDDSGRHVTKYYQDENGQKHETIEFYPKDGSAPRNAPEITGPSTSTIPSSDISPFFSLFDRIFRPRM